VGNGSGIEPRPRVFQFGAAGGQNLTRTVPSMVVCGRLEGNGMEGERPVVSERWSAWRADPQPRTTQRCMRRHQRLLVVVLGTWNRGGRREAEQREYGKSGGAEREEVCLCFGAQARGG
jgi:hypothetical protein